MAVEPRSGSSHGGSGIMLGFQKAYGTPITRNADMVPRIFTIDTLSPNPQTESIENPAVTILGSSSPAEQGRSWSEFNATFGLNPEEIMHFLRGIFNPDIGSGSTTFVKSTLASQTVTLASGFLTGANAKPDFPSRLKVTNSGGTIATDATMTLIGFAKEGSEDSKLRRQLRRETVPLTTAANGGTSTGFFQELLSSGDISGSLAVVLSGVTGGTNTYSWEPETHKTFAKLQSSDPQFPGYTVMGTEGGIPFVMEDVVPGNFGLEGSDTGITGSMTGFGTIMDWERTVAGGALQRKLALDATDVSYFQKQSAVRMPAWAGGFSFGTLDVTWSTISTSFERNYEFSAGQSGKKIRRGVSPSADRTLTITTSTPLEAPTALTDTGYLDATDLYRRKVSLPLTYTMRNYDENDRETVIEVKIPEARISEEPQRSVDGGGPISMDLTFQGFTSGTTTSEIEVTVYSENEYSAPIVP